MKVEYNSENSISNEIFIDGIKYIYCEGSTGTNNLVWIKNDYVYQLEGHFSKDELTKIAQSIE